MFIIFTYGVKTPKEILGTSHLVVIIVTMVIHRLKIHLEEYLGIRHMVVMSVLIMMRCKLKILWTTQIQQRPMLSC